MKTLRLYIPFTILAAAFIWGAVCYMNDATFVAYLPCIGGVLWAFDFGSK